MKITKSARQSFAETFAELVWAMDESDPEDTVEYEGRPQTKHECTQTIRRLADKHLSHE